MIETTCLTLEQEFYCWYLRNLFILFSSSCQSWRNCFSTWIKKNYTFPQLQINVHIVNKCKFQFNINQINKQDCHHFFDNIILFYIEVKTTLTTINRKKQSDAEKSGKRTQKHLYFLKEIINQIYFKNKVI